MKTKTQPTRQSLKNEINLAIQNNNQSHIDWYLKHKEELGFKNPEDLLMRYFNDNKPR